MNSPIFLRSFLALYLYCFVFTFWTFCLTYMSYPHSSTLVCYPFNNHIGGSLKGAAVSKENRTRKKQKGNKYCLNLTQKFKHSMFAWITHAVTFSGILFNWNSPHNKVHHSMMLPKYSPPTNRWHLLLTAKWSGTHIFILRLENREGFYALAL